MNGYHDVAGRVVFLSSRRRSSIVGVTGNIQQIGIRGRGWCCKFHRDVLHSVVLVSWVAGWWWCCSRSGADFKCRRVRWGSCTQTDLIVCHILITSTEMFLCAKSHKTIACGLRLPFHPPLHPRRSTTDNQLLWLAE